MVSRGRLPIVANLRSILLPLLVVVAYPCYAQAPATTAAQLDRAARFVDAGDWQKAERTLRAVLRADPNQADALNLLGIVAGKQGRTDEAEALFRKAMVSNPSLAAAWANLAQLYKQRGDVKRALQTLEEGLGYAPHDPRLLSETAMQLAERSQFSEAVRRLQAVPPAARTSDYWELLGQLYLSAGDFTQAEENLRRALQGKPDSVTALRQLAGIALKQGDPARAWQYLSRALRLAPNSPELLYEYAQVCLQDKLSSEAVLAMRKAVLMEPDRPEFSFFLGNALLETPDFTRRLPTFRATSRYVQTISKVTFCLAWRSSSERTFPKPGSSWKERPG